MYHPGSVFTDDGSYTRESQKRLAMGRSIMQSLSSIWKSKDTSTPTEVRLLKTLVWSLAVYGCEYWTVGHFFLKTKNILIKAFERCIRTIEDCFLRMSRTKHKTNEWILQ